MMKRNRRRLHEPYGLHGLTTLSSILSIPFIWSILFSARAASSESPRETS
jgi:hypothetical protein